MTDRPIIFSAPMVRALIGGRKTQTRRLLKEQRHVAAPALVGGRWQWLGTSGAVLGDVRLPYASGDRLWVRETWRPHYLGDGVWDVDVSYPADGSRRRIFDGEFGEKDWNWPKAADRGNVTPLHMPRWASRLTLTVTDVRVQLVQDISEADAVAEGALQPWIAEPESDTRTARSEFEAVWNSIHGPGAWDANPWVVALTFTVKQGNIDAA